MAANNYGHQGYDPLEGVLDSMEEIQQQAQVSEDDPVKTAPQPRAQGTLAQTTTDKYKPLMWGLVVAAAALLSFT